MPDQPGRAVVENPANHLLRKIPNPEALRGVPDPILVTRIETAIARERATYLQEMSKDVQHLINLLTTGASPDRLWPLAHELRCMAGTFAYPFLTEVAQVLCGLIKKHQTQSRLPPDIAEVFAHALQRARDHRGPFTDKQESVVGGLRKIAARPVHAPPPAEPERQQAFLDA